MSGGELQPGQNRDRVGNRGEHGVRPIGSPQPNITYPKQKTGVERNVLELLNQAAFDRAIEGELARERR